MASPADGKAVVPESPSGNRTQAQEAYSRCRNDQNRRGAQGGVRFLKWLPERQRLKRGGCPPRFHTSIHRYSLYRHAACPERSDKRCERREHDACWRFTVPVLSGYRYASLRGFTFVIRIAIGPVKSKKTRHVPQRRLKPVSGCFSFLTCRLFGRCSHQCSAESALRSRGQ